MNPQEISNLMIKAVTERSAQGGIVTESSLKEALGDRWDNDLLLSILVPNTSGRTRELIQKRLRFLDLKSQAIKLAIFVIVCSVLLAIFGTR